jgi:acetyl/propionyl-CoA carboxylase alpha subunit
LETNHLKIKRVLIANRGEIAVRIAKTLKWMGIEACAVYSTVDADAPHVLAADRAMCLGEAAAKDSYLNQEKILNAAEQLGCDSVHPGYGFLSENASFATACRERGLLFIGPSPHAIHAMGDKGEARRIAALAGVSPVPGFDQSQDDGDLRKAAAEIGFPLLVKAAKGGGGKGMRVVRTAADLSESVAAARREAMAAFGDPAVILERQVFPARHIEVQLLADRHGQVAFLMERECSLQRRHQKVIEECPSAAVTTAVRGKLRDAATALARAVSYEGAGTIEFLMEEDGRFWFLEMNTRLQVEHAVTEMVINEDLVAWQIRIAEGEAMDERLLSPVPRGHAIEARVYAEDPDRQFLPSSGRIHALRIPSGPGIRVDCGVREGQEVTPFYDPMLMKVIAHGRDREEAGHRLGMALRELVVLGPATNHGWLREILVSDDFKAHRTYTHTLEVAWKAGSSNPIPDEVFSLYAAATESSRASGGAGTVAGQKPSSSFEDLGPFRLVRGDMS